ncbi:MAG: integrase/recombinase XerD [Chloroflexota bacterium]|nr:integrase/recombinase XerD [Chloroflexota bacterium]
MIQPASADVTVAEAERTFLDSLVGKSPRTVTTYASGLRRLDEFFAMRRLDAARLATTELPETILVDFQTWLIKAYGKDGRATIATYVAGVRAFLRDLARRRLLAPDVSFEALRDHARSALGRSSYRAPRVDGRLPLVVLYVKNVPLPDPATQRQAYLEILRDRALILTLFSTGMRREEAANLDRADVDDGWASQAIIRGKGDRERVVFFTDEALEAIRAYLVARGDEYVPVFIRNDRARSRARGRGSNYRLSPLSVWKTVKKYSKLAEVPISTHDFRHAKATVLLNQGAKLSEVQDILGHASPETTKKIYAHYEVQHLRDAFDRYTLSAEEMADRLERRRGPHDSAES